MGVLDGSGVRRPLIPAAAGQSYSADTTGKTVALNQVLAHAEYFDGGLYAMAASTPFYLPVSISVPATPRNVCLEFQVSVEVQTSGRGIVGATVYEITNDGFTTTKTALISSVISSGSGGFVAGDVDADLETPFKSFLIGPTTTERTFALAALFFRTTGSALAVSTRTTSTGNSRHFLRAVALS